MKPVSRSFLFVPGNRPERFAKAVNSGADAVIIDLEDAVAVEEKAAARAACRAFLESGGSTLVRVNGLDTEWSREDLALCSLPGVEGVVLPKAESKTGILDLARQLRPATPILPLIETAVGMVNVREIAESPGVLRLLFGTVDFCLDLAIECGGEELDIHRWQLVLTSRAARLQAPVDGVTLDVQQSETLRQATLHARRMGFGGKLCIHPSQAAVVNACFVPTPTELDWARKIVGLASFSDGVFVYEGKMVDAPVIERARRLLQSVNP
jgi:citrate lyase subunit beta/citryl-CoA lyase